MGSDRQAVIVLGMHRSGTSALSGVLHLAGINFGSDDKFIEAEKNKNDKGYYEHREIVLLDDKLLTLVNSSWDDYRRISPEKLHSKEFDEIKKSFIKILKKDFYNSNLFGIKDPRMCRLLPLWAGVFEDLGISVKYVIMCRHPFEVCKSLQKRDGMKREKAYLLWLSYMLDMEEYTNNKPRTFVLYDDLLHDWRRVISRIDDELGLSLELTVESSAVSVIDEFLSDDLRHTVATDDFENEQGIGWAKYIYQAIETHAYRSNASEEIHKKFNLIRDCYWKAMEIFSLIIYEKGSAADELSLLRKDLSRLTAAYESKNIEFERYKYKRTFSGFIAIVLERAKEKTTKFWKYIKRQ